MGPFGDNRRHITIQPDKSIVAGCFHGGYLEFKTKVIAKYGESYGTYSECIIMLDALLIKEERVEP